MNKEQANIKLVVLGGGESGTGAALLGQQKGFDVFLSDNNPIKEVYRAKLQIAGIAYEEGQHSTDRLLDAELVVKSPGIPQTAPVVVALHEKGVPVISEIEFAWRYATSPIIAITGSNGKTTTTHLTHHILKKAGLDARMAGNVGSSFAGALLSEKQADVWVLELSSFQLDGIVEFRPDVAMILNITPDHLDRYNHSLEEYADSKMRIAMNQTPSDSLIYCLDDELLVSKIAVQNPASKLYPFTCEPLENDQTQPAAGFEGAWVENDQLTVQLKKKDFKCQFTNWP